MERGGLLRALALSVAVSCAALLHGCGGGGGDAEPIAAIDYAGDALELRFWLDSQERIATFEMRDANSQRPVEWCTGDLYASWECRVERSSPYRTVSAVVDAEGRAQDYRDDVEAPWGTRIAYTHDASGRLTLVDAKSYSYGNETSRTSTLEYDANGHLAVIRLRVYSVKPGPRYESTYTILDPHAAPMRVAVAQTPIVFDPSPPETSSSTIELTYDSTGRISRKIVNQIVGGVERIKSKGDYVTDSHGFVTRIAGESYGYEPGEPPVTRGEQTWELDWSPDGLAREAGYLYSVAYPAGRRPRVPFTVFPPYSVTSASDLRCIVADQCVDPVRLAPRI
jgi:hypothetical protein